MLDAVRLATGSGWRPSTPHGPEGDVRSTWADSERAARELGYRPRMSLEEGVAAQVGVGAADGLIGLRLGPDLELVLVPILLYLPGHFLGEVLSRKGDGWADLVLLRVACAVAVSTPVLVALALLGWFTAPVIAGCLVACAATAWFLSRRYRYRGDRSRVRPGRWDLAALALVAGAFALYAHPAEYVLKDRDPGVTR